MHTLNLQWHLPVGEGVGVDLRTATVEIRFDAEGIFANRIDEGLVISGHDNDAAFGHRVAATVFVEVEADAGAARDEHVAIDNGAPDPRVPADTNAGHQNRTVDLAETVHTDVRAEHAADDPAAGDDAARRDDRIQCLPATPACIRKDERRR